MSEINQTKQNNKPSLITNIQIKNVNNNINSDKQERSNSAKSTTRSNNENKKEMFSKIVTQVNENSRNSIKTNSAKKEVKRNTHSVAKVSLKNNLIPHLLPSKTSKFEGKKTLVLDLDETLIHANFEEFEKGSDIKISVRIDKNLYQIYALKRPGVEEFLERMSKLYEIVIYTASLQQVYFYFSMLIELSI